MFDLHYDGKLFDSGNLTVIVVCWADRALENVWQYYGWAVTDELPDWSIRLYSGIVIWKYLFQSYSFSEQQNSNYVLFPHNSYITHTNRFRLQTMSHADSAFDVITPDKRWRPLHNLSRTSLWFLCRAVLLCRLLLKSDSGYVICWWWVIGLEVSSYYHCTAGDRQDTNTRHTQ